MSHLPKNAMVISAYSELAAYVQAFAEYKLNLLAIVGRPGIQKSVLLRQAVEQDALWLEGNVTPFQMYCELFEHVNQLVVIDDVDSLQNDRNGVRLLKCLCQTDDRKRVSWHSSASRLEKNGIPTSFSTTSRVAIVANDWRTLNQNILAVEDRGHVIHFDPSPMEVHRRTSQWFWNQQVFDFIGAHLTHVARDQNSMRLYIKADELQSAQLDWQSFILSRFMKGNELAVAQLKANATFQSEKEREQEFRRLTGASRSTYYEIARKLPPAERVEKITLSAKARECVNHETTPQSWIDEFRRCHGR